MIIYKVTSPSNKIYIGLSTTSLEIRKSNHLRSAKKSKLPFHRALNKYKDAMIWEIIDTASTIEELKQKEIYYINKYDSFKNGYNRTMGGEGCFGLIHNNYTKKILSEKSKRQWFELDELDKKKRIENNLNYRGLNKISVVDSLGNKFASITDAADYHGLTGGAISRLIKLKRPSRKLISFKYNEGEDSCPNYIYLPKKGGRKLTDGEKLNKRLTNYANKRIIDNFGNKYISISDAARILKISRDNIKKSLNKNIVLFNGMRFYYDNK